MRILLALLCIPCLSLTSCVGTPESHVPESAVWQRVEPMEYDQWNVREFTRVGLRMNLPIDARAEEVFDGKQWILSMGFHYLSAPPGVLADATVFVRVYVEKINAAEMAREFVYQSKGRSEESRKYWRWFFELHPTTSKYEKGQYSYFRRDVKLNDLEILHAHAEVLNAGPQESRAADHAAVRRILDSIEPLEEMGSAKES